MPIVASGGMRPRVSLAKNSTATSVSSSETTVGSAAPPTVTPSPASHSASAMPADEICASDHYGVLADVQVVPTSA